MKHIIIFSILSFFDTTPSFSQSSFQNDFKGCWYSGVYKDTIKINFIDTARIFVELSHNDKVQGYYKFDARNSKIILRICPDDKMRRDTLLFIMTKLNTEEYNIEALFRMYSDGRPPEQLLLERATYLLRRLKTI